MCKKNPNKNPVAEKAVEELEGEIAHQQPQGGAITHVRLAVATALLNSGVRGRGLSAREMWTQRDQHTSEQMPVPDHKLITEQHLLRTTNHTHSELSKGPGGTMVPEPPIGVGDWCTYTPTATSLGHVTDTWL